MKKTAKLYGDWLSNYSWNLIVTIRRHYRITEYNIQNMIKRFISKGIFKRIFYVIEKDRLDNMTHIHLLIETPVKYNNKRLAKLLMINVGAIRYLEEVVDSVAVARYCSKDISKNVIHYDFIEYKKNTKYLS
jgi:hypothetical protein